MLVIGKLKMIMKKIVRILLLIPGLLSEFIELAKNGSRDIANKKRFKNCIIDKGSCLNAQTKLNKHVRVLGGSIINSSTVNSYTYIGNNCLIQNTTIGKFCSIANDVKIGLGNHPIDYFTTSPLFYNSINPLKISLIENKNGFKEYMPITIGNDVWIGTAATLLDGVTVGHGAIIATGSVVTKNVPPYAIVAGMPAKIIKYRFEKTKIDKLLNEAWWNDDILTIKNKIEKLNSLC